MLKSFFLLLIAGAWIATAQTKQAPSNASDSTMPPARAAATFKDARVVSFLKNVQDGFKLSCTAPDAAGTRARITLPNIPKDAPPQAAGYASTYYEVTVPCSASAAVLVNAEFTPLTGDQPLKVILLFKQELQK